MVQYIEIEVILTKRSLIIQESRKKPIIMEISPGKRVIVVIILPRAISILAYLK